MMSPSARLALLVATAGLAAAAAGLASASAASITAALATVALLALALVDLALLARREPAVVVRAAALTGALRRGLRLEHEVLGGGVREVALSCPFELGGPLAPTRASPRLEAQTLVWRTVPRRRGEHAQGPLWLRRLSPLGLWHRREVLTPPSRVEVLPDLRGPADDVLGREALGEGERAAVGLLAESGELRGLRPFQRGDDPRHVDWKATARYAAPIVRDWQPDRRRSVIAVLDAGRLMRAEHDGESKLDAAVRSLARLAISAEAHGDRVGALVYAHEVLRQVPPLYGAGQAARLLRYVADLSAQGVESDLGRAVPYLLAHARRSLVVIVTDVVDAAGVQSLVPAVREIMRQHVPIVALLRDPHLDEALARPIAHERDAFVRVAAELAGRERHAAIDELRARGVRALDLSMRSLALEVVQAYLRARLRAPL